METCTLSTDRGRSRADSDKRYQTSEKGRAAVAKARRKYERTLCGWANKQIRRIRYRCENRRAKMYYRYGGRGIKLLMTADDLMELVGGGPWLGMTPHRIDNDGDYEPGNVVLLTGPDHRAAHNDEVPI